MQAATSDGQPTPIAKSASGTGTPAGVATPGTDVRPEGAAALDRLMDPPGESRSEMLLHWSNRPIDEYCERHGPGLLAEPVNALTNFCIIAAGLFILRIYRRDIVGKHGRHYPLFLLLIALVILLGLGSLAWHTFAVTWAMWADLVPIIALILVYQWAVLRLIFRWSRKETLAFLALFGAVSGALIGGVGDRAFNGSVIYLPAVAALVWFGVKMKREGKYGWQYMAAGVAVFLLAIFLRTLDMAVCGWLPVGTHFTWHVLNSILVWFLAKSLILGYVGGMRRRVVKPEARLTM